MYVYVVKNAEDEGKRSADYGRLDPSMRNVEMLHVISCNKDLVEDSDRWTVRYITGMLFKVRRFKTKEALKRFLDMIEVMS